MSFKRRNIPMTDDLKKEISGAKNIFEVFYSMSTATPPGAYPLWTGEWIRGCASLYPDFYKMALQYRSTRQIRVLDNTAYENEIKNYGECGAFVIQGDDIRLPKINNYLRSYTSTVDMGKTLPAGLPNITGNLPVGENFSASYGGALAFTGAFKAYEPRNHWGTNGGWDTDNLGVNFDASRCSSVYGASNTVQPPSVQVALYIQVYNHVAMEGYVNIKDVLNLVTNYTNQMDQKIQDALNTINSIIEGGALGMPEYERSTNLGENVYAGTYTYTAPSDGWFYVRWVNSNADPTRITTVRIYKDASKAHLLATHTTSDGRRAGKDGGTTDQTIFVPVRRGYFLEAVNTNYRRFYPVFGQ